MDRDYREIEGRSFRRVVEEDKGDIGSCDIALASCHRASAGTLWKYSMHGSAARMLI